MSAFHESKLLAITRDLVVPVVLMASFGTFYWAIRGTGGYGGSTGGLFAGVGWATCWWYLANRPGVPRGPLASRWVLPTLALGVALGGLHGYGQFISWIKGTFMITRVPLVVESIDPAWGFLALLQCGLSWGITAGVLLSWAGSKRSPTMKTWVVRLTFLVFGGLAGWLFFAAFPGLLLPLHDTGIYTSLAGYLQIDRAYSTAESSAILFGMSCGLLAGEIAAREWRAVLLATITGAGFGVGFVAGAAWFFSGEPMAWKFWEMSIGCVGGASIGVAYWACNARGAGGSTSEPPVDRGKDRGVVVGNLAVTLGVMVAISNGLNTDGFADNFYPDDAGAALVMYIVTAALLAPLLIAFIVSVVNHGKGKPASSLARTPFRLFVLVQAVLFTIGFITSVHPVMAPGNWTLIIAYAVVLAIGLVSIAIPVSPRVPR